MKTALLGAVTLAAASFTLVGYTGQQSELVTQERPNVVVIMTDDMRYDDLAAMPQTRRLLGGDNGARYTNAYVSTPLCCPSRATFLTGQHSHNNGVWYNSGPNGAADALDDSSTLPVWLQRSGYDTAMIGKYLNGVGVPDDGIAESYVPPGWTTWVANTQPVPSNYTDFHLSVGSSTPDGAGTSVVKHVTNGYQTWHMTRRAVNRIEKSSNPLFLWLSFYAPHGGSGDYPHYKVPVPAKYRGDSKVGLPSSAAVDEANVTDKPSWIQGLPRLSDKTKNLIVTERRERRDSLKVVDDGVADVVAALEDSGELDNTVIVFTSDNGFTLGEHRLPRTKSVPYPEASHVPLLIRGPGFTPGTHTEPVSNVDLAPTIADLAGVTPGVTVDGMSLLDPVPADRPILVEYRGEPTPYGMPTYASVIRPGWQYTEYAHGRELYNRARDPWQQRNRISDSSLGSDLDVLLEQLRDCVGAECLP